jgi:uncharacterized protein (DUF488 family)
VRASIGRKRVGIGSSVSGMAGIVPTLYTVGHSTHEPGDFVALLRRHGVEALADVRRYPGSRRVPWTNSHELAALLARAGIAYVHLEALGGRRGAVAGSPNTGWTNDQFQGYADHMASPEFAAALDVLEARARERPTAVMCAEAQWWRCHRRLLSDVVLQRGWHVCHIDARGGVAAHELTPFAVPREGRLEYPPEQASLDV